jgi:hypothetical protein
MKFAVQLRSTEEDKSNQPSHRPDRPVYRTLAFKVSVIVSVLIAAGAAGAVGAAVSGKGKADSGYTGLASPTPTSSTSASAASSSPSRNLSALGANLTPLPVNVALTGSAARAWAAAALDALGAPKTAANVRTMVDWFANEGTPHDLNNPLNLQTPMGGSSTSTASGASTSASIQAYLTPADFIAAFPVEMTSRSYPAIAAALKSGQGLEGNAATQEIASELLTYSGYGYDSIPANYNR